MWEKVSRAAKTETVDFVAALPMSNVDRLQSIFEAVSDPKNAKYGQWMSKAEINELTATPGWVANSVLSWLESAGNSCTRRSDSIKCRGTVSSIEAMLSTRMHTYQHKKSGDRVHQVDSTYSFPEEMNGKIEFISGLNGFPVEHLGRARKLEAGEQYTVPETLVNMYSLSGASGSSSTTQAAAEFQNYPAFSATDLNEFIKQTGVPSFSVAKKIGPFNPDEPQPESTLDVQYLGAVGTGVTNWYWTEAGWMYEFTQDLMSAGESGTPDIISMSYGWDEEDQCQISPSSPPCQSGNSTTFVTRVNAEFAKVGTNGITLMASSGDSGAHGRTDPLCQKATTSPAYPAASPNILAVGATQFDLTTVKTGGKSPFCQSNTCKIGGTEIVCSPKTGALIASGGGFSEVASRPSYQDKQVTAYLASSGVPPSSDFNTKGRGYPDVAALGHAYYIQLNGEALAVDGTSCSSPVFAGVVGLLAAKSQKGKFGHIAPLLYSIYEKDSTSFNDITTGDNFCTESTCNCQTGFKATTGWDATSGMGTPNYAKIVANMQAMGI
jgi:tripeptidyl-peptidase-1